MSSGIEALGTNFSGDGAYRGINGSYSPNSFGASAGIKAVMIASGGLCGGISSSIAGGSFWKGVREGLITSGLNPVAHMVVDDGGGKEKKKNQPTRSREQLKAYFNQLAGEYLIDGPYPINAVIATFTKLIRHVLGPDAIFIGVSVSANPLGVGVYAANGLLLIFKRS